MGELLNVDEVAEILGVPVATLRNWRYRGEGPVSFKIGGSVRYRKAELERWIGDQESSTRRGESR